MTLFRVTCRVYGEMRHEAGVCLQRGVQRGGINVCGAGSSRPTVSMGARAPELAAAVGEEPLFTEHAHRQTRASVDAVRRSRHVHVAGR